MVVLLMVEEEEEQEGKTEQMTLHLLTHKITSYKLKWVQHP